MKRAIDFKADLKKVGTMWQLEPGDGCSYIISARVEECSSLGWGATALLGVTLWNSDGRKGSSALIPIPSTFSKYYSDQRLIAPRLESWDLRFSESDHFANNPCTRRAVLAFATWWISEHEGFGIENPYANTFSNNPPVDGYRV